MSLWACALAAAASNADIVTAAQARWASRSTTTRRTAPWSIPAATCPRDRGVCTDVVVRALRTARALDLQKLVHEDLKANWDAYPHQRRWNLAKPDPNIDHRRVPNLMTWFRRAGSGRKPSRDAAAYLPGDIVAWDLGRGILHIGIVSEPPDRRRRALVVHNIGAGAREEDILFRYTIIGQYRLPAPAPPTEAQGATAVQPRPRPGAGTVKRRYRFVLRH